MMRHILVKPAGAFCNLRCDYCFYLEKSHLYGGAPASHRMSDSVLEKMIKEMFALSDQPVFTWHGGEPALLGIDFFEKAVRLQHRLGRGKPFLNAFQTNGVLMDERWADLFLRENFLVGISLDGPSHVHDSYRKDIHGVGTFQNVYKNAVMLLKKGVQVNILATVNDYSARHGEEIYRFFRDSGFCFMQFTPVLEPDREAPGKLAAYSVDSKVYGRFLTGLFDAWIKDFDFKHLRQKTSIRFFDALIQSLAGILPDHCLFQEQCGTYLVCEHNGDLFPCDYLVCPETRIGNLNEITLQQAYASESRTAFSARKSFLDQECGECQWLSLCRGGCIKDRLADPRDKGRNHFCASNKYFFKRAEKTLRKLAALYREQQSIRQRPLQ